MRLSLTPSDLTNKPQSLLTDETPNHPWVRCGPLAVSTLTLMCILTVRPVRARAYELFLAVHLIGALCVPHTPFPSPLLTNPFS